MLASIKRRLSRVEEFLPVPITAEQFCGRVHRLAMRTDGNVESAMANLAMELNDLERASLTAELERIVFGSDTAARDAFKREVLTEGGYPVWNLPSGVSRDQGVAKPACEVSN